MAEGRHGVSGSWVHWVLDDCHEGSIPYVFRYFEAHRQRLENLLEGYFVQPKSLTLRVSRGTAAASWHLDAMLTLPSGVLVAEGRDETLMGAMDRALDTLRIDLKRHLRQTTGVLPAGAGQQQGFLQPRATGTLMAAATG